MGNEPRATRSTLFPSPDGSSLYLSTSSPPVETGALKPTLRVLPSTASSVTFSGGLLGCGSGMTYGVSAIADGPTREGAQNMYNRYCTEVKDGRPMQKVCSVKMEI